MTTPKPLMPSKELTVRPDLCTTGDAVHGGAIMAFADTLGAVGTFQNLTEGAAPRR